MISIIIPTFNASKTISIAIESIINQSYKNFELLIIDALSTDDTIEIVKRYFDDRIRIVSEKDKGIYDAMNKGIQLAKGDWIYFLGSDDYLLNDDCLEKVSKYLTTNYDFIYGNVVWGETGEIYDGPFTLEKLVKEKNICHQAIFHNKNIYKKLGNYELKYKYCADHYFNIQCFMKGYKTRFIDLSIAYYNTNGLSSTGGDIEFQKKHKLFLIELFEDPNEVYYNHLNYKRLKKNFFFRFVIKCYQLIKKL